MTLTLTINLTLLPPGSQKDRDLARILRDLTQCADDGDYTGLRTEQSICLPGTSVVVGRLSVD